MRAIAEVGVFGGSGLYSLLEDAAEHVIETKWGAPSAPLTVGTVGDVRVAFLPRHGLSHEFPPHRVNYRANIDAMRQLGVSALVSPFACGSLRADYRPGDLVVVDQLVDRTWGRPDTFYDEFAQGPAHVSLADPYDRDIGIALTHSARDLGWTVHERGTVVVINGPRFSTRAESSWFRSAGFDLVNMTQYPEAALAREAGLRYAGLALVTDFDSGLEGEPGIDPVSQEQVFAEFDRNIERLRELLLHALTAVASTRRQV
jgi:5'-methylthioadenosine phosphorylase